MPPHPVNPTHGSNPNSNSLNVFFFIIFSPLVIVSVQIRDPQDSCRSGYGSGVILIVLEGSHAVVAPVVAVVQANFHTRVCRRDEAQSFVLVPAGVSLEIPVLGNMGSRLYRAHGSNRAGGATSPPRRSHKPKLGAATVAFLPPSPHEPKSGTKHHQGANDAHNDASYCATAQTIAGVLLKAGIVRAARGTRYDSNGLDGTFSRDGRPLRLLRYASLHSQN